MSAATNKPYLQDLIDSTPDDPAQIPLEDTAMSFEEWRSAGFVVMKGQKSEVRDALGVPQFTLDQVKQVRFPKLIRATPDALTNRKAMTEIKRKMRNPKYRTH